MHADAPLASRRSMCCFVRIVRAAQTRRALPRSQMAAVFFFFPERRLEKSSDLSLSSTRTPVFYPLKSDGLAWINPAGSARRAEPIGTHESN